MIAFFVLAFGISWLPWPLVALNPQSSPMVPFGPLIAAAVVALWTRSFRRLFAQLGRWRGPVRWYLAAVFVPLALLVPLTPAVRFDWVQVAVFFAATVIVVGVFEEVGWRGFALPRLQERMSRLRAALLLGVIWAVWHLPELVSDPSGQRPVAPFLILVVAQSVFFGRLYNSSPAGLPLVIISHAVVDTSARFVLPMFTGAHYLLVWWALAGLWTVVAVIVSVRPAASGRRSRVLEDSLTLPPGGTR